MSGLFNPFAFSVQGQALAPPVPPAFRVMDGQATGQQLALAQQAFHGFCALTRTSAVPNPTQQGRLADGTPYKIHVNGRVATMQIWADPRHRGITEIDPHEEDCGERPLYPSMPTPIMDLYVQGGHFQYHKTFNTLGIVTDYGIRNIYGIGEPMDGMDFYIHVYLQSEWDAMGGVKNAASLVKSRRVTMPFSSSYLESDVTIDGQGNGWTRTDYVNWPLTPSISGCDLLIEEIQSDYTSYVAPFTEGGDLFETLINGYMLFKNGVLEEDRRTYVSRGQDGFPQWEDFAKARNAPKIARRDEIEEYNRVTYAEFEKKRDAWIKCVGTNLEHYMRIAKEENDPGFTPVYIHI